MKGPSAPSTDPDPRPWERTEELFFTASELPADAWRDFLLDACGGDLVWVEEIESLLGAEADADQRIEGVIAGTLDLASQETSSTSPLLAEVGPYKILRELGRGGMSTVYLAERADEHYRQLVAIKVVKRGMDSGEILRRLRQERQILANLEHPHIARLLDGGNTAEGLPYFVMEYVDGEPIDAYCRRLNLSVERRLALFRDVLSAVAYAHRNLVVHRDLKPANILVTGSGQVKLLDFGIAKLTDPEQAAEFGATSAAIRFYTVDYASPEQILGRALTTASDVYSLGVLLFEMLTGRRPHGDVHGRRQLETAICEWDPPSASGSVPIETPGGQTLRRVLQGDLDAILSNALRREETRRYASVDPFAEDLRRYVEGLPVLARGDTPAYRFGKFLRRHRWAVGGVTLAALTLVTLVTFYTLRLTAERNRAQSESQKATQVSSFLRGLFEHADPGRVRGPQVTVRELLQQGSARIDAELADQPDVQADLMDLMGSVYLSLGFFDDADPLLETSEALRLDLFGEQAQASLASRLHRGQWFYAVGDYDGAEAIYQGLLERSPGDLGPELRGHVQVSYGNLLYDLERVEEAETLFRDALALHRELYGNEHPTVATGLNDLGATLYLRGEFDGAEAFLRQALNLRRRLLGDDHPDVANTLSTLGVLLSVQDRGGQGDAQDQNIRERGDEGIELLDAALGIRRRLYGPGHPLVATTLNNLGELSRRRGELDAAVAYLTESADVARQAHGDDHPAYADTLANLARAVQMQGNSAVSVGLYREAVDATRKAYVGDNHKLASTLQRLGEALIDFGDRDAAEAAYREALGMQRRVFSDTDWRVAHPLLRLGRSRLERGEAASAEPLLQEAYAIRLQRPEHWRTAEAKGWLGACRKALGRSEEGRALLAEAYTELQQRRGEEAEETLLMEQLLHED